MIKWIVLLLLLLVLFSAAIDLFIPNKISVKETSRFAVNAQAFTRVLFNEASWQQMLDESKSEKTSSPDAFTYNGKVYKIVGKKTFSLEISVQKDSYPVLTELVVIPFRSDSIELNWLVSLKTPFNPVTRLQVYSWTKHLQTDLQQLLEKIASYYTTTEHLYGINVREEKVVDSLLISTAITTKDYPATDLIYNLIDNLKAFAQKNSAKQTGLPMLNITPQPDSSYLTRVALPVNKKLNDEGDIHYKWMLGGGNVLVAEVKGGPTQIKKAFERMENYKNDFGRVEPAISFQSLVTDRRAEPDTNKWVTKLYWPVM